MNITLAPELKAFVDDKVKDGSYRDAGEVVGEALRLAHARSPHVNAYASGDIQALAFHVMMEAAKSADEDLKAIMDMVKAMTAAKRNLRELVGKVRRDVVANVERPGGENPDFSEGMGSERAYHRCPIPVPDPDAPGGVRLVSVDLAGTKIETADHIRAIHEDLQSRLDSLSEMTELDSLRLQMIMDRHSKLTATLSNILKHLGSTQSCLIHNLK